MCIVCLYKLEISGSIDINLTFVMVLFLCTGIGYCLCMVQFKACCLLRYVNAHVH